MGEKPKVSERDREHFRRIAEAEVELNRESIRACGKRDPGRNIEIGLALSEFAASFAAEWGARLDRPDEVPMIRLWRARGVQG